jgi:hypothetical protein
MKSFVLCFIAVLSVNIFCQQKEDIVSLFSGSIHYDAKMVPLTPDDKNKVDLEIKKTKNTYLAGALSLIIPGAGQFYNQSYWKAAAFVAIEATAIFIGVKYDNKGDDKTTAYHNFADAHWSVNRYVDWTITNIKSINSSVDITGYKLKNSDGSVNWQEMNRLERDLGSGYSHALPVHGDQQYFELIGKYPQYSHGWDDSNQKDTDFHILSPNFLDYSGQRGKANDYYNVAAKAVIVIYLNHLVSVVDAIWEAAGINKDLKAHAGIDRTEFFGVVDYSPKLTLSYNF